MSRSLRMDQQRGRGRPGRVLGLLPRQLAAHAAVPEGLARALRGRGPADHRRAHRRVPAVARRGRNVRRAVERLEIPWAVAIDTELRSGTIYGNEGWPARYLWDRELMLHSLHYGEGAYAETEREIQALLGVDARRRSRRCAPRTRRTRWSPRRRADQPGAYCGPYEAGGVWAVVDGAGDAARQRRARSRCAEPGCVALVAARAPHGGRAGARARPGRERLRHLLHARRGLSTSWPRSPSRRSSRGGPSSSTSDRRARPVGRAVRLGGEEVRLVDPRAGVARSARRRPPSTPPGRPPATARSGGSGPRARGRRRRSPSRRTTSRIPCR